MHRIFEYIRNFFISVFEYLIFGKKYSNIRIYLNIRYALLQHISGNLRQISSISHTCFRDISGKSKANLTHIWNTSDISLLYLFQAYLKQMSGISQAYPRNILGIQSHLFSILLLLFCISSTKNNPVLVYTFVTLLKRIF